MTKYNASNERIKRTYYLYLEEAMGRDETTIDAVAKSIARFEDSTGRKEFRRFHREQAVAFKRRLANELNQRTGERLSKSTLLSTLRDLRAFFFWLAHLPGFKSHIAYADADYFNLSDKHVAVARARREKNVPTLAQVEHVLSVMPADTIVQRRDRALIAFAMLTVTRARALTTLCLAHVDVAGGYVDHDAREVRTKFGKTFRTYFMPVSDRALSIVNEWHAELSGDVTRGPGDALFPSTAMALDSKGGFAAAGLHRHGWSNSQPVRKIFRRAFTLAGLPYFNPHSFRDMLVRHAMSLDLSPEAMKAWSQNLAHADVLTTFTSYGRVPTHRQGELVRAAARKHGEGVSIDDKALLAALSTRLAKAT